MKGFNIIALDDNYQIVSLLLFTNLQWNRKYHECGTFSIQIPIELYLPEMKYIYTKDRPELGKVMQVNYIDSGSYKYIQLSGYFIEKDLDRHVVYPKGTGNIINSPEWTEQSGKAEDVAHAFFAGFKSIQISGNGSELSIIPRTSLGRGNAAVHTRNGEKLGNKIYNILKPSGMSYRVIYDFANNIRYFETWAGLDRTDVNEEGNNPVVFSTKYGNIKKPNILLDETDYKNACIVTNEDAFASRAVFLVESDEEIKFAYLDSMLSKDDYTDAAFQMALENEGLNKIAEHPSIINVEFDALEGSYEYMKDFDLGDKCSVEIPEMNLSLQARLIGCYEVVKKGLWTMTMEFGTPIILKR